MKTVVKQYTSHELISVKDIILHNEVGTPKIIAYRPHGRRKDGLAILTRQRDDFSDGGGYIIVISLRINVAQCIS